MSRIPDVSNDLAASMIPDIPPFIGYIETTVDALRLVQAARNGIIPRIVRRLNDSERRSMIQSGAVFVYSVEESGIKRWTDGFKWSPSRIMGNFLVYRQMNEMSSRHSYDNEPYPCNVLPMVPEGSPDRTPIEIKKYGKKYGKYKVGGLRKKTITVIMGGSELHLIAYYTSNDVRSGRLKSPSTRSEIMHVYIPLDIVKLNYLRKPPKVERGPDGKDRLVEEYSDQIDFKVEERGHIVSAPSTGDHHTEDYSGIRDLTSSPIYLSHGQTGKLASGQIISLPCSPHRKGGENRAKIFGLTPIDTTNSHLDGKAIEPDGLSSKSVYRHNQSQDPTVYSTCVGKKSICPDDYVQYHQPCEGIPFARRVNKGNGPLPSPLRDHSPYLTSRGSALQRLHWLPSGAPERPPNPCDLPSSSSPGAFRPQTYHATPTYTAAWTPGTNMTAKFTPQSYGETYTSATPSATGSVGYADTGYPQSEINLERPPSI